MASDLAYPKIMTRMVGGLREHVMCSTGAIRVIPNVWVPQFSESVGCEMAVARALGEHPRVQLIIMKHNSKYWEKSQDYL